MPRSYSQLSAYRTCPRKFQYAFVKKMKPPMDSATSFGVSVHSALAKWGKREVENGERKVESGQASLFGEAPSERPTALTLELLLQLWQESFVVEGHGDKASADFERKRGEILMQKFFDWWKEEERKVLAIEKGFNLEQVRGPSTLPVRGSASTFALRASADRQDDILMITGRFDRVEELPDGTLSVIDYKTGGLRSQESVDQDLQLSVYAAAAKEKFGKDVSELTMLFLCDEDVTEIKTTRSDAELVDATKTIRLFSERIASGDYAPTPSIKVCKGCPYRRVCDAAASP